MVKIWLKCVKYGNYLWLFMLKKVDIEQQPREPLPN